MSMKEPALFSPIKIKSLDIKNRMTVSPMCMYSSEDGFTNNWHLVHLGSRAVGGAGLILTEAAAISPEGRITPQDMGLWKDDHIQGLAEIVEFVEAQGSQIGIQLAHAGRKASCAAPWQGGERVLPENGGWTPVGPSAIPFNENDPAPTALDKAGIEKVVSDFVEATKRAVKAGFKVVEIHAAHGYLLHEFLSPLSNKRTDEYGGSFENRSRLILQVIKEVKKVWPADLPLFVRISATDWVEGGWDIEESVQLSKLLKVEGVDLIDCSSGGLVPDAKIPAEKGYQVGFAERIKKEANILTGAVGLITEPNQAEEILENEKADLILMAREFLRTPYFPLEAANELDVDLEWPNQYARAKRRKQHS